MKSEERKILEELNQQGFNLKEEENTYSRFDAFNDNYIVEIKNRSEVYSDTFIEFDKYSYNLTYSKLNDKVFLYVVKMDNKTYIFNVSDLDEQGYNFKWEWRTLPKQTEFKNKQNTNKYIGYINLNKTINMEQKENSGAIFKNNYKKAETHPDYKGKMNVDGKEKEVALWVRETKNGEKFFSMAISEPYKPQPVAEKAQKIANSVKKNIEEDINKAENFNDAFSKTEVDDDLPF